MLASLGALVGWTVFLCSADYGIRKRRAWPSAWYFVRCTVYIYKLFNYWASLVAQMVKESPCSAGDLGLIPGLGNPLEKGMVTYSSILPWRIHGHYIYIQHIYASYMYRLIIHHIYYSAIHAFYCINYV